MTYACEATNTDGAHSKGIRNMSRTRIVLSGLGASLAGLSWETDRLLRIGRQNTLEVVLRDFSVDRLHAEVKFAGGRWVLRDLARSPLYPTLLNQQHVHNADRPLAANDVIQLGKLMLRVTAMDSAEAGGRLVSVPSPQTGPFVEQQIRASGLHMRVQAATSRSWNQALEEVTRERSLPITPLPATLRPRRRACSCRRACWHWSARIST